MHLDFLRASAACFTTPHAEWGGGTESWDYFRREMRKSSSLGERIVIIVGPVVCKVFRPLKIKRDKQLTKIRFAVVVAVVSNRHIATYAEILVARTQYHRRATPLNAECDNIASNTLGSCVKAL